MRSIALIDCNNFYCSVQKVFRPDLATTPIIVLSNNDAAIVSRSVEAKKIGLKMGEPFFKVRDLCRKHNVEVFSSNYALYADMSNRVMNILRQFSPIAEVYSIDEIFVDCTGFTDIPERAREMKRRVGAYTNIPVCVGVASSKTLAKLANFVAKRHPKSQGIFDYNALTESQRISVLSNIPPAEVWGIGRRLDAALASMGIETVLQLRDADIGMMRARFGVVMEMTIRELRGEACIEIEEVAPPKKQIINSRSFGKATGEVVDLEEALAHFVTNAASKLRAQNSVAGMLQVFIMTDRFREDQPQYSPSISIPLTNPTADTIALQNWAVKGLAQIYKPGFQYRKAGVILSEICSNNLSQGDLFSASIDASNSKLMQVMDAMNKKYGRGTLKLSQDGTQKNWAMKQERKSPSYTTDWYQLPECN